MQPKKAKTVHDTRGSRIKCVNFQMCPLCYGCRRYSSVDPDCIICLQQNKKMNICNKDLHRDDLATKMITKDTIKFSTPIAFTSNCSATI